jgi:ABC-type phosphate/phosphonate transport system substrate-binding protein
MSTRRNGLTRRGFCLAGMTGLLAGTAGWGREPEVPNPVKLGLVGSLFREIPSGLVLFAMQPFKVLLEDELGVSSRLVAGGDPIKLAEELRDGKVQLAVFHGTEFAWAQARYPKLKPLFIAVNGAPTVSAHLLVRKGSPYRTVEDLKGKTLTVPGRTREHCWMFLERRCVKPGMKPTAYYSKLRRIASPEEAMNEVGAGLCPAALIDGADWAEYQATQPMKAAKVRPLLSSEPLPCALIACWDGSLDTTMLTKFRNGMLAAASTEKGRELLKVMRITGFQRIPDDFDKQLEAAAKAYPPPTPK